MRSGIDDDYIPLGGNETDQPNRDSIMSIMVQVTYRGRDNTPGVAEVRVDYDEYDDVYYATHLGLWGCGKNSRTIEGAVRMLVQDMATIDKIEPL